jgi:hypothetical protein
LPEEVDTEAAAPPLLAAELGSEINPVAFASTILPRPPTVTTTSPRLASTVRSDDCAGAGLWSLQTMTATASATAAESPRSVRRRCLPSSPITLAASILAPLLGIGA